MPGAAIQSSSALTRSSRTSGTGGLSPGPSRRRCSRRGTRGCSRGWRAPADRVAVGELAGQVRRRELVHLGRPRPVRGADHRRDAVVVTPVGDAGDAVDPLVQSLGVRVGTERAEQLGDPRELALTPREDVDLGVLVQESGRVGLVGRRVRTAVHHDRARVDRLRRDGARRGCAPGTTCSPSTTGPGCARWRAARRASARGRSRRCRRSNTAISVPSSTTRAYATIMPRPRFALCSGEW